MKLIVVRHGESNYNVENRMNFTPTKKCHLTEKGMKQAYQVKEKLKEKNWDVVIISELYRTEQTAAIINEDKQKFIFIDARINDINSGEEGIAYEDYHTSLEKEKDIPKREVIPKNGESYVMMRDRVQEFLDELKKKPFDSVLIVTHHIIIKAMQQLINQVSDEESVKSRVKNAEVFEFKI